MVPGPVCLGCLYDLFNNGLLAEEMANCREKGRRRSRGLRQWRKIEGGDAGEDVATGWAKGAL